MRRWSAIIEHHAARGFSTAIEANPPANDLMREQLQVALRQASRRFADELAVGDSVSVILFKETKQHGVQRDRIYVVYRDKRGRVVAQ